MSKKNTSTSYILCRVNVQRKEKRKIDLIAYSLSGEICGKVANGMENVYLLMVLKKKSTLKKLALSKIDKHNHIKALMVGTRMGQIQNTQEQCFKETRCTHYDGVKNEKFHKFLKKS